MILSIAGRLLLAGSAVFTGACSQDVSAEQSDASDARGVGSDAQTESLQPEQRADCDAARESTEGKISAADQQYWDTSEGPYVVMIMMELELPLSTAPTCSRPPATCPAMDKIIAERQTAFADSQRCAKALITSMGGTLNDVEQFWLINVFTATLTLEQIDAVAALPGVRSVESNVGGPPP